ncbi:hypothetical protein [Amycolatopsis sp. NPDC004079]|uniref:hypothetical protein n=1 Tax=Amycolatopsis sp. NPDC004079 TaxID=3154549 RepID=UPI0033AD5294
MTEEPPAPPAPSGSGRDAAGDRAPALPAAAEEKPAGSGQTGSEVCTGLAAGADAGPMLTGVCSRGAAPPPGEGPAEHPEPARRPDRAARPALRQAAPARRAARAARRALSDRLDRGVPFDTDQWLVAVTWCLFPAVCAAAMTWSGAYYVEYPALPVYIAATAGGGAGTALAIWRGPRMSVRSALLLPHLPVIGAVLLLSHFVPDPVWPDPRADLDAYRGNCLVGTPYSGTSIQAMQLAAGAITVVPARGPEIRFRETGHRWPSAERAHIDGESVVPADAATRAVLDSLGCR